MTAAPVPPAAPLFSPPRSPGRSSEVSSSLRSALTSLSHSVSPSLLPFCSLVVSTPPPSEPSYVSLEASLQPTRRRLSASAVTTAPAPVTMATPTHPFIKWTADSAHGRVGLDGARQNRFLYLNASHSKRVIPFFDNVKKEVQC